MAPVPNRRLQAWFARASGVAVAVATVLPALVAAQPGRVPQPVRILGQAGADVGPAYVNDPMGVAVSPAEDGRVFVVDRGNARVVVYDPDTGMTLGTWGGRGTAPYQFWLPTDVAVSPDGRYVYVLDEGQRRVKRFEPQPECFLPGARDCFGANRVLAFGIYGTRGEGVLQGPTGLAVDRQGLVYVADPLLHRIVVFTSEGKPQPGIGSPGNEKGELLNPTDVAVHPDGSIWVADTGNDRISFFSPEGVYKGQWTGGAERLFRPTGIAIDADGAFVVRDYEQSYQLPKAALYEPKKSKQWKLTLGTDDPDSAFPFQGAAFLPGGAVILTDPRAPTNVLVKVMPDGSSWPWGGTRGLHPLQFDRPLAVALDQSLIGVVDADNHRVVLFERLLDEVKFVGVLGSAFTTDFLLPSPAGIAIHRQGPLPTDALVYVTDSATHSVYVAAPPTDRKARWGDGNARSGPEGFKSPHGIAVAPNGDVYIADTGNNRIVRRAGYPRDEVLGLIGTAGSGPGQLDYPMAVAYGPGDRIYVLEANSNRLQAFAPDGSFIDAWTPSREGRNGAVEPGELWLPQALGTDGEHLYILESDAPSDHVRVQVVDPRPGLPLADSLVAVFAGRPGPDRNELWDPHGVAAVGDGLVAVADSGNNRVVLYRWPDVGTPPPPSPTDSPTPTEPPTAAPTATETLPPTPTATQPPATRLPETPTPTATQPPPSETPATEPPSPTVAPPSPSAPPSTTPTTEPGSSPTPTATDSQPANTKPTPCCGRWRAYIPITVKRFYVGTKWR